MTTPRDLVDLTSPACGHPRCIRGAALLIVRERTYPLVVPLLRGRAPRAAGFAVRWGFA